MGMEFESHMGVREAAEFCTHTRIDPGGIGLQKQLIGPSWNEVNLGSQTWNPEGMNDIGAVQSQSNRGAHRNMYFITKCYLWTAFRGRIGNLPPPLVPGHINMERGFIRDVGACHPVTRRDTRH